MRLKYHPRYYKKEKLLLILSGVSLLFHLLAIYYYIRIEKNNAVLISFEWQFLILVVTSFLFSLITTFIYRNTERSIFPWIFSQWIIIMMLGYPLGRDLIVESVLICNLIIQTILLIQSFRNTVFFISIMIISFILFQHKTRYLDFSIESPSGYQILIFSFFLCFLAGTFYLLKLLFSRARFQEVEIQQLRTAADRLIKANRSFQEYAYEIEQVSSEKERLRLSRELHDIVGYTMVNINMMMEDAIDKHIQKNTAQVFPLIISTRDLARNSHQEIREALIKFREKRQLKRPFLNELTAMIKVFSEASGVNVILHAPQSFSFLSQDLCYQLLRIIQEGLTNAIYHGRAKQIEIILVRNQTGITLVISDDGIGAETIKEGIGITGMRERLKIINGSLQINSKKDYFKLKVDIPVN